MAYKVCTSITKSLLQSLRPRINMERIEQRHPKYIYSISIHKSRLTIPLPSGQAMKFAGHGILSLDLHQEDQF